MFCVHPLARSPQARLRITGRICPMRGNNPSPEHTCRVGDRRGMTTERPGSPVTFCDGHHTDIANRALAQHQPLSNVGVAHSWIAGHMRRVARSAYRHRARPWTGAHEEAPSLTTIPHPAPPLDDYRVVAARRPADASPGVRHPRPGSITCRHERAWLRSTDLADGDAQPPGARGHGRRRGVESARGRAHHVTRCPGSRAVTTTPGPHLPDHSPVTFPGCARS